MSSSTPDIESLRGIKTVLKQNTDITVVSRRLGHSSIAITAHTYGNPLQGVDENADARFDAAMNETYNEVVIGQK